MIICVIDGHKAVPEIKDSIRLIRENPFIKEKDSYTMDVSFPLSILENRQAFGALGRIEVSKRTRKFDDCQLYVSNQLVIRGSGYVTQATRETVKIQILAGKSSVKFRTEFEGIFIDRISYMTVDQKYAANVRIKSTGSEPLCDVTSELSSKGYVGNKMNYVFMPVWDSTNDCMANQVCSYGSSSYVLFNRAVQPNLMMVLTKVLQQLGYTVAYNAYDMAPWNELIICSARQTAIISNALPHWSARKLIDEFSKLFNATFLFSETDKTVRIVHADAAGDQNVVSYQAVDEFETSYDEDGLEYIGASNIDYNLSDMGTRPAKVPVEVLQEFTVREYDSKAAMNSGAAQLSAREKLTSLFICPEGFFYFSEDKDGDGNPTGTLTRKGTGEFTQLTRDVQSSSTVSLNICPVAMIHEMRDLNHFTSALTAWHNSDWAEREVWLPTIENSYSADGANLKDVEDRDYVTVEDVIEAGIDARQEETEEETILQLMWIDEMDTFPTSASWTGKLPRVYTDFRFATARGSYSLALTHAAGSSYVGQFHERVVRINEGSTLDYNNEVCIMFLCDGIPDPSNLYNFSGKLFLCSKIETPISDKGIERLKTGYFYEIL